MARSLRVVVRDTPKSPIVMVGYSSDVACCSSTAWSRTVHIVSLYYHFRFGVLPLSVLMSECMRYPLFNSFPKSLLRSDLNGPSVMLVWASVNHFRRCQRKGFRWNDLPCLVLQAQELQISVFTIVEEVAILVVHVEVFVVAQPQQTLSVSSHWSEPSRLPPWRVDCEFY